ncbi:MAG: DUF6438 domain-containing protein [Nitrososphaera sp.]
MASFALNVKSIPFLTGALLLTTFVLTTDSSFGSIEEYFVLQAPQVWLKEGGQLNEYDLREHDLSVGIILKSLTDEYREYIVLIEIRKLPEGTTSFIFVVPEETDEGEEEHIRVPWAPEESGRFQVRVFLISDFESPQVLSSVMTSETSIYDDSFKGLARLSKSPCDGVCPSYYVEVYQNRTAVFEGYDYIAKPGRHVFEASQDQMNQLIVAIIESDFLSSEYDFTEGGTEGFPVVELEINLDGK